MYLLITTKQQNTLAVIKRSLIKNVEAQYKHDELCYKTAHNMTSV